jgi:hypothetical protein
MQNDTHIRIPPTAHLGEIAYRAFITHQPTYSAGSWATWDQLTDEHRYPWEMVALDVAEQVAQANDHADA